MIAGVERRVQLEAANLDGSGRRVLAWQEVRVPGALHVHEHADTLYWADRELELIERLHLLAPAQRQVSLLFTNYYIV